MPIVRGQAGFELRCVNDPGDGPTTMRSLVEGAPAFGIPLNVYICSTCRYVELYAIEAKSSDLSDEKTPVSR